VKTVSTLRDGGRAIGCTGSGDLSKGGHPRGVKVHGNAFVGGKEGTGSFNGIKERKLPKTGRN